MLDPFSVTHTQNAALTIWEYENTFYEENRLDQWLISSDFSVMFWKKKSLSNPKRKTYAKPMPDLLTIINWNLIVYIKNKYSFVTFLKICWPSRIFTSQRKKERKKKELISQKKLLLKARSDFGKLISLKIKIFSKV